MQQPSFTSQFYAGTVLRAERVGLRAGKTGALKEIF
jgi:hypothetical protein